MPLSAQLPVIDNRTFDDIVAEAQTRIPRYTQEWTDFNAGDAGFALVELFAWMTELMIYRLGQMPQLNYIKFLQLIGIELTPAKPAQTVLVFPMQSGFAQTSVPVSMGTQVSAAAPSGGAPIVFETQAAITALKAPLDAVLAFDGTYYTDVTADNVTSADGFQPFGPFAAAGSALLLGFNPKQPLPAGVAVSFAIWPSTSRGVPSPSPCGGDASPVYAPARIGWEFWAGTAWQSLKVLSDTTVAFTLPGFVQVMLPAAGQIVLSTMPGKVDAPRAWLRARLVEAFYESAPALSLVSANAVGAIAAQTVQNEVVGGSDGTPNQTFTLSSTPVLDGTLDLQIDEGSGPEPWTQVDDFSASGSNDNVYLLDPTTGTITLGDGVQGHIPVANLNDPSGSIVAVSYQFGGGANTNLQAGATLTLMTSIPGIDAGNIGMPFDAYGGSDEETLQSAMNRAPEALKSQDRAVTLEDYEMLARQAGPIARAKALPLFHPDFPGMQVPGVVSVVVVPDVVSPAPMPSPGLLRTVCAYLDQRRLIATELYVIAPTYVPVSITLQVLAQPDADTAAVEQAVESALSAYLDPLAGGSVDAATPGTGWPFGGPIYFVDVLRVAAQVADVIRIADLAITLNGALAPACTDVAVPAGALLSVQSVVATVTTDATAMGAIA
ncbi:putative baseplate assembly protein [Paraburkholderia sp. MM5477-R1]|uniref:putative baseplate assembly protein n=1 Tax=Paraburkholderia sp. MM5477-R1 TaxID=2991062 RepID=UPI003D249131